MDQGGGFTAAPARRISQLALWRADGRGQLSRPGSPGCSRSSRGHRGISRRALSQRASFRFGPCRVQRGGAPRCWSVGRPGPRRKRIAAHARSRSTCATLPTLPFAGFANQHALTLDVGQWTAGHPLRLLLHGFIEYFSASSMYAAWQANLEPMAPYVEAQLPDGSWKRVIDDMGFPAGLPRTIVVDLTGKLPPGTRRIRLVPRICRSIGIRR